MSNDIKVLFTRYEKDAVIPTYSHYNDAGCDLYSIEDFDIYEGEIHVTDLGFSMEIQDGIEAQIRSRSGLATKSGLIVVNTPGTIDPGYRGPIKVGLINLEKDVARVKVGDRIAQMIFSPVYKGHFIEVDSLSDTDRGVAGFGSTGKGRK